MMEENILIKGIMSLFKNKEYFVLLLNVEHFMSLHFGIRAQFIKLGPMSHFAN